MNHNQSLLSAGLSKARHNKRYIFWFYVLNAIMAWFGAGAFNNQVHAILDHSLRAGRLLHGLDIGVLIAMLESPEFGPTAASSASAFHFALLFYALTVVFLPGVLQGYASSYRLPREDFFRACGRNLWRFIRLLIVAGIVMGVVAGILFGTRAPLLKRAQESTNELLPFYVSLASWCLIFLVMTALRIWFDLAQTDVVLSDQRAVRRSIGAGFRHAWRDLGQLLGSYVLITIVAAVICVAGILLWIKLVPPASVLGAVLIGQLTLLFLLIPRFWQRGVAVTYYLQNMVEPIPLQPFTPAPVVVEPVALPMEPPLPSESGA